MIIRNVKEGDTLLDLIREAGLPIEALCSGRGTCGKCRVMVDGAEMLACRTPAVEGMLVEILSPTEGQEILTDSGAGAGIAEAIPPSGSQGSQEIPADRGRGGAGAGIAGAKSARAMSSEGSQEILIGGAGAGESPAGDMPQTSAGTPGLSGRAAIAIDVGTTTVVVKAVDPVSGKELGVRAFVNPQRAYGADVLSRINNAMDDATKLSALIRESIDNAIAELLYEANGCNTNVLLKPEKIVIAGNTTMMYLLLNLRCRSLGLAPFEPEYGIKQAYTYREVFGTDTASCPVRIYPFISAFVGGDIVSGLVNIERHLEGGAAPSYMLVDMGTNGEIAYRNGSRLLTTSTAAGPALEGGNITCGMSGLPGAIYAAGYEGEGRFSYKTIGGKAALGICGSGVISLMGALLEAGLVSESGAFSDKGNEIAAIIAINTATGAAANTAANTSANNAANTAAGSKAGPASKAFVIAGDTLFFTQKDVREFQLAKGAIRAGIDILIEEMGEAPKALYLAGGFGQNIDLDSAFRVGLIPRALEGRIRFAGNTSLGGCVDACLDASLSATSIVGGTDAPLSAGGVPDAGAKTDSDAGSEGGADTGIGTGIDPDALLSSTSVVGDPDASLPSIAVGAQVQEINLGSHKSFNNKFMETMLFEEAL